jgi:hypothetical protein
MPFGRRSGVVSVVVLSAGALLVSAPLAGAQSTASVTIAGPTTSVLAGSTFHITGTVSPESTAQPVVLQRWFGGRFRRVATQNISTVGRYDFSRTLQTPGDYAYRVKASATASVPAATSATIHIPVTTAFMRASAVRAQSWVDAHVAYSMSHTYTNRYGTYRTDCSGYVSMAWALPSSYTTATLPSISIGIAKTELRRGDVLLHKATPGGFGHVVLFDQWANSTHTSYKGYEESPNSGAVLHVLPYPYWSGHGTYLPYRRTGT